MLDVADGRHRNPVPLGKIPEGGFPRDLAVSRDGRTVFVSNLGSRSLTLLDVARRRSLVAPAQPQ